MVLMEETNENPTKKYNFSNNDNTLRLNQSQKMRITSGIL